MKTNVLVAVLVAASFSSAPALAQLASPDAPVYSHSELKHLIHTARTSKEFNAVADYFDQKRDQYVHKASDEQIELNRRLAAPYLSPKYPTPVDTARGLLRYYQAKVEEYGRRADEYRSLAKQASTMNPPESR
jgi:hypothetical protein